MANKENKTDLERSHSKSSNFKLTMIAFLGALGFAAVWIGVALILKGDTQVLGFSPLAYGLPISIGGGVALLLSYFLIARFTR